MPVSDSPLLSSLQGLRASSSSMRSILEELSQVLHADSSWSRAEIHRAGEILLDRKKALSMEGIWESPPLMATATLDDAIGQGLRIIHLFSRLAGVNVAPLGLMQPPEKIVDACRQSRPDILGLTILQFHSEEILCQIAESIPPHTQVIVGGPIFKAMLPEELAAKGYRVLNDMRLFIDFLLNF